MERLEMRGDDGPVCLSQTFPSFPDALCCTNQPTLTVPLGSHGEPGNTRRLHKLGSPHLSYSAAWDDRQSLIARRYVQERA